MTEAVLDSPATESPTTATAPTIAKRAELSLASSAAIKRKQRWSRFIKLVRRSHLYAGLFMTPWVLLYGITAFLFNHPSILSDQTVIPLDASNGAAFAAMVPDASKIATDTIARINAEAKSEFRLDESVPPRFSRPLTLAMTDGTSQFQVTYDLETQSGNVRVTPVRAATNTPVALRSESGLPTRLPFDGFDVAKAVGDLAPVLASSGIEAGALKSSEPAFTGFPGFPGGEGEAGTRRPRGPAGEGDTPKAKNAESKDTASPAGEGDAPARKSRGRGGEGEAAAKDAAGGPARKQGGRGGEGGPGRGAPAQAGAPQQAPVGGGRGLPQGPEVAFVMKDSSDAKRNVSYNLRTGALTVQKEGETGAAAAGGGLPLSTRRYFLRLHTAHGYPDSINSRWIWAVIVDVMFVCMVGWAATGVIMWHQMKHLRRIGWVVLSASLVASVVLAIGMHSEMVAAGR